MQLWRRFLNLFMPYDLYERHAVVSRLLREATGDDRGTVSILDVGGRAALLERFVPYRVISINPDRSGDLAGSGLALPFAGSSFSVVVSIDTLEHLPPASRLPFLQECLRVARRYVLVAAPLGSTGHRECEKRLDSLYRSVHGRPHAYLSEHIRHGLPDVAELDRLAGNLPLANARRLFAGDYAWQGQQFERAILGQRRRGIVARVENAYRYVTSWALFHPVRLGDRPGATTNRFYWLMEKAPG